MKRYISKLSSTTVINARNYSSRLTHGCLLGVGNPLLDYVIHVNPLINNKIIDQFQLKRNSDNIINESSKSIFEYVNQNIENCSIMPGGAAQNAIRIAQSLLKKPGSTTFLGAIGDDKEAIILRDELHKCNVHLSYQTVSGFGTGKCLIIMCGNERTLVTDLGASKHLNKNILDERHVKGRFDLANFIYLEGFLWVTNPCLMIQLAKEAQDKTIVTSLHAEFLTPHFIEPENNFLQYVDILFGNQYEALSLAKALALLSRLQSIREKFSEFLNLPITCADSLARIALLIDQHSRKKSKFPRLIVFTQTSQRVVLCFNGEIHKVSIPKMLGTNVMNSPGCGDAFVGGFLSEIINGKSPAEAVQMGLKMSQYVISQYSSSTSTVLKKLNK